MPRKCSRGSQPETVFVAEPFVTFCTNRYGWRCHKTHGNLYSSGWPDYYFTHAEYDPRWVETKLLRLSTDGSLSHNCQFTRAQKVRFPEFMAHGVGIWIIAHNNLVGNIKALEEQYRVLFRPPNCYRYLYHTH